MSELYRSDNLCVRATPGADVSRWFITFDHVGHDTSLDREGFGKSYFESRGISVVSVVGRGNHWYQYPDMPQALDAIRQALVCARVRIAYGSSMGGYAAIRFADRIGATGCLAISPQYSIDPRKVPFERRWLREARSIQWHAELEAPIRSRIAPVVVFDPRSDDARHVALIAVDTRLVPISIPYGGHPVTTYLLAANLLTGLVDVVHDGTLDAVVFQSVARQRRKSTPQWIGELARRQPVHRSALAERLAREALRQSPDAPLLLHILAQILTTRRAHAEALEMHVRAYILGGRPVDYGLPYSWALYLAGFDGAALDIALKLRDLYPESTLVSEWVAELHFRAGSLAGAIEQAAGALGNMSVGTDPKSAHYLQLLKKQRETRGPAIVRRVRSWLRRNWLRQDIGRASAFGKGGMTGA